MLLSQLMVCSCSELKKMILEEKIATCEDLLHAPSQENVQQDATSRCDQLEHHDIGTSEMQARAEATRIVSTNGTH